MSKYVNFSRLTAFLNKYKFRLLDECVSSMKHSGVQDLLKYQYILYVGLNKICLVLGSLLEVSVEIYPPSEYSTVWTPEGLGSGSEAGTETRSQWSSQVQSVKKGRQTGTSIRLNTSHYIHHNITTSHYTSHSSISFSGLQKKIPNFDIIMKVIQLFKLKSDFTVITRLSYLILKFVKPSVLFL